ncbi:glutamine amidotransferase class-I [Desulfofarcimen acetoxidans DSM 771]|uniref:Glutamine amidotransferase class-I n=1 Tax=Desulfofarcimen acetoxidans (strain ATCC 49208 / DSM 771 / KCTC 5769 / VKM B-1644 / 5575) TaxID=485916 RepID=C8W2F6_DESAS|nr:glutamine amidotransferase [Desulfofarcimen acetoxidans]ACV63640.1 glutamine amidotransferase class-I [Desulfofarcimen acetoxidans DSM 771]
MKKLLIIKTGTTFPSIRETYGDFDDFIINQADISPAGVMVSAIYKDKFLPDYKDVSAVIITGSHSMITDNDNWSIYLSRWLRASVHESIPVLGICYGHQLLARAFGGYVDFHPGGKEIGTVNIELTEQGENDPLLSVLPKKFLGHVTHAQSVINLPVSGQLLAKNCFEGHHAFSINNNIWGVQFHPEFNAGITREYINEQAPCLIKEGYDINQLHNSVREHVYGKILLKRFWELI